MDILATVQNLLRRCLDPSAFLAPLSKLFSIIMNKLPRMALTKTFLVPASNSPKQHFQRAGPSSKPLAASTSFVLRLHFQKICFLK